MTVQGIPSVSESICKGKGKSVRRKQQTKEAKIVVKAASKTKLRNAVRNRTKHNKLKTMPAENIPTGCVTIQKRAE